MSVMNVFSKNNVIGGCLHFFFFLFFEDALIERVKEIDFGWIWTASKNCNIFTLKGVKERPETKEVIEAEEACSKAICDSSKFTLKYYESFKHSGYTFFVTDYCDEV
jgi:hypothetical protein